ncbi:MAG: hypothetical protein KOO61_09000 [Spirochaetales bacterium]|nr:hypothetical protein [Spirochaetales bacterium]
MKRIITLRVDEQEYTVTAYRKEEKIIVERDGVVHTVQVLAERSGETVAKAVNPSPERSIPAPSAPTQPVQTGAAGGKETLGEDVSAALAPMAGVVKEVLVASGDKVTEGQRVLVMEAMKMDVYVNAPVTGTVKTVSAAVGVAVDGGNVLLTIEGEGA